MSNKIKTVKDFVLIERQQFEVLKRKRYTVYPECKSGKPEVKIHMCVLSPDGSGNEIEAAHDIIVESEDNTLIKEVRRINDGFIFYVQESAKLKHTDTECVIVEFKEDLITCVVYMLSDLSCAEIEINSLKGIKKFVVGDEDDDYHEDEEYVQEDEEYIKEIKEGWFDV